MQDALVTPDWVASVLGKRVLVEKLFKTIMLNLYWAKVYIEW